MKNVSLEIANRKAMRVTKTSSQTSRTPALPGVRPVQAATLSILVLLAPQTAPPASAASAAPLQVGFLRTKYKENPLKIDARKPRLSWQLQASSRGVMQSAYQIRVATSEGALKSGSPLL